MSKEHRWEEDPVLSWVYTPTFDFLEPSGWSTVRPHVYRGSITLVLGVVLAFIHTNHILRRSWVKKSARIAWLIGLLELLISVVLPAPRWAKACFMVVFGGISAVLLFIVGTAYVCCDQDTRSNDTDIEQQGVNAENIELDQATGPAPSTMTVPEKVPL